MSLAAKLPYDHAYAGGYPGIGSQPLPTDADALDYLARVKAADGAGVEVGVAVAVDAFFKELKATPGLFSAIKASCILCGARTLAGALVPLAGTAPTNNNFVAADYNRETGLIGNGSTKYLDSNSTGTSGGQDDAHFSVFCTVLPTSSGMNYIGRLVLGSAVAQSQTSGSNSFTALNDTTVASTLATPSANSLIGASRDSSTSFVHVSGDATEVKASTSQSQSGANDFYVFSRNYAPSPQYSDARLAFYSIGESLDLEALGDAVSVLVTAIGAAV